jgi:hypothetical protein
MDNVKPEAVPALYEHARNVYAEMVKQAKYVRRSDGVELLVYEGHLTQLFKKLRLSTPYYTTLKNRLIDMNCIEQIKRGGGSATSQWVLWNQPTLAAWGIVVARSPRVRGDRTTVLEQRQRDQLELIKVLSAAVKELSEKVDTLQQLMARG